MSTIQKENTKVNYTYEGLNSNPNIIIEEKTVLNEKIKNLQRKLKAYQIMTVDQNKKITELDNLIIEYNSLNKNYCELESELNYLKLQNAQLMDALNYKNCLIDEYQKMIEISTEKFKLLDEHNNNILKNQKKPNQDDEYTLKSNPNKLKGNKDDLNNKINNYENEIENLKEQYEKKEELQKVKLNNLEKNHKNQIKNYEEEIRKNKIKIEQLKTDLENLKRR